MTKGCEAIEPQWLRSRERINPATLLQGGQDAIQADRLDVASLRLLDGLTQRNGVFWLLHKEVHQIRSKTAWITAIRCSSRLRIWLRNMSPNSAPNSRCKPSGGSAGLGLPCGAMRSRNQATDPALVSTQTTSLKPVLTSRARISSGGSRKLMVWSCAHGTGK